MDGVTVTVQADEGVFPAGSNLQVQTVSAEVEAKVSEAVDEARDTTREVAASYTFDIKVLDAEGNEVQPADGDHVHVSFAAAEVADESLATEIFHIDGETGEAEAKYVMENGEVATVEADGFSVYAITFTYSERDGSGTYTMPADVDEVAFDVVMKELGIHANIFSIESSDPSVITVVPPTVKQKAVVENGSTKRDQDGQVVLEDCSPTVLTSLQKTEYPPTQGSDWTIKRGTSESGAATLTLTLFDRPTYFITIETEGATMDSDIVLRHADGTIGTSFRISELIRVQVTGATEDEMKGYTYSYSVSNAVNNGTIQCFNDTQVVAGNDGTAIGTGGLGRRYFAMERPENYQTASCTMGVTVKSGNKTIATKTFNLQFAQSNLQADLNDASRSIHPITVHVGDTVNLKERLAEAGIVHPNCGFTFITIDNSMTLAPTSDKGVFEAKNSGTESVLVRVKKLGCHYHSGRGALYDGQEGTFYLDVYSLPNAQAEVDKDSGDLNLSGLNPYSAYTLKNDTTGEEVTFDASTLTFKDLSENTEYIVSVRQAATEETMSPDTTYKMSDFKTSLTMTGLDSNYQYRLSRSNEDKTPWLTPNASGVVTFENLTPNVKNYKLLKIDRALAEESITIQPNYPANNNANGYTRYQSNLVNTKEWRITSTDGNTVYVDWTKGGGANATLGAAGTLTKGTDYLLWSRPYVTQTEEQTNVATGAATLRVNAYPGRYYKLAKGTATGDPTCDGVSVGDGWYTPKDEQKVLTFSSMSGTNTQTYIFSSKQPGQAASETRGTTKVTTGSGTIGATTGAAPEIVGTTANTVTVKVLPGMEYSIDGGNTWKDSSTAFLENLPGGTYTITEIIDGINFISSEAAQPTTINTSSDSGSSATFDVKRYGVHFDKNADDATGTMENQNLDIGKEENLTANAYKWAGHTFTGWNTKADGSGTAYADKASVKDLSTTVGAVVTLYAQWEVGAPDKPKAPSLKSQTADSITLENVVAGATYIVRDAEGNPVLDKDNNPIEVAATDADVPDKLIISGLQPGTKYQIVAINKGTGEDQPDSDETEPLEVYTKAATPAAPYPKATSSTSITVEDPVDGVEYALLDKDGNPVKDGEGNPVVPKKVDNAIVFEGLEPGTTYKVSATVPRNGDVPASDPVVGQVTTNSKASTPDAPTVTAGATSVKVDEPQSGQEYIILPKSKELADSDWENAQKLSETQTTIEFTGLTVGEDYVVYTRVSGDTTTDPSEPASVEVKTGKETVGEDSLTNKNKPTAVGDITYDGNAHELVAAPEEMPSGFGGVVYGTKNAQGEIEWLPSGELPTGTDATAADKPYEIYVKYVGDEAHNDLVLKDPIAVSIAPKELTGEEVTFSNTVLTYTGEEQGPTITVKLGANDLTLDTDYTLTGAKATEASDTAYTVTVKGKGNFTGEVKESYTISAKAYNAETDTLDIVFDKAEFTYNMNDQRPTSATVKLNNVALAAGTDYRIDYPEESIDANTYTATLVLEGNYSGTKDTTYVINRKPLTDSEIETVFAATTFIYSGTEQGPEISVKHDGSPLVEGTDFELSDQRATHAGNYEAKVTGKGNYTDEKTGAYVINRYKANPEDTITVTFPNGDQTSFMYNGNVQKPEESKIVVKLNDTVLAAGTDYEVVYSNPDSKDMGAYFVTIVLKGDFASDSDTQKGYSIAAQSLTKVEGDPVSFEYNGQPQGPGNIKVYSGDSLLGSGDYMLTDETAIEVGKHELVAHGVGNYSGVAKLEYEITKGKNTDKPNAPEEGSVSAPTPTTIEINPSDSKQEYLVMPAKANGEPYTDEELADLWEKAKPGNDGVLIIGEDGTGKALEPGKDYVVVSRYAETDNYLPSKPSDPKTVATPKNTQNQPSAEGIVTTPDSLEEGVDNGTITIPADTMSGKKMEYWDGEATDENGEPKWTEVPNDGKIEGLSDGTYQIRYAGDDTTDPSDSISVVVKAAPGAPSGDVETTTTTDDAAEDKDKASSITVNPSVVGQEYIVIPKDATPEQIEAAWEGEGSKKDGNGGAITFDDLKPGTAYEVLTRTPATETAEASLPATKTVGTAPLAPNPASDYVKPNYSDESLKAEDGYQILKPKANPEDPDEWVTEVKPFDPNTQYQVRKAEDKQNGIPAGNPGTYTSLGRPTAPDAPQVTTKPAASDTDTAGVIINPVENNVVYTVKDDEGNTVYSVEPAEDGTFVVKTPSGETVKTIEPKDGTLTIDGLESNKQYTVEANYPATADAFASESTSPIAVITPKAAPEGLAVEKKVSGEGKTDGVVSVDTTAGGKMEYSTDGGTNWKPVPDNGKIENLGAGEVQVRYAEVPASDSTPAQAASAPATITLAEGAVTPSKPTTENDENGKPVITIDPSQNDQVYVVVPVKRDGDGNIIALTDDELDNAFKNGVDGTGDALTIGTDATTGNPLQPGTEYRVITRTKGENPSDPVATDPVYTKPEAPNADSVIKADTAKESLTADNGYEIKNPDAKPGDPDEWVRVIKPFEPGKEYEVRKAADPEKGIPASDPAPYKAPEQAAPPASATGLGATTDTVTVKPSDPAQEYLVLPTTKDAQGNVVPAKVVDGELVPMTEEEIEDAFKNAAEGTVQDGVGADEALKFGTDANGNKVEPGTSYVVLNRVKATEGTPASGDEPATPGKTASKPAVSQPVNTQNPAPDAAPKVETATNDDAGTSTVTVNPADPEVEYIVVPKGTKPGDIDWDKAASPKDGETTLTISKDADGKPLQPGTEYVVVSRTKATDTGAPSEPTEGTPIATTPVAPKVEAAPAEPGSETVGIIVKPADDKLVYTVKDKGGNVVKVLTPDPENPGTYKVTDEDGNLLDPSSAAKDEGGALTIDGLRPGKEYTVEATTNTNPASDPATSKPVKTNPSELDPSTLTGDKAATANDNPPLVYDGAQHDLIVAPKVVPEGYTMQYSTDGEHWSENIPTGTDAGKYQVYVRYQGNDDAHKTYTVDNPIEVTIAKAEIKAEDVVLASTKFTYSGQQQGPEVTVKVGGNVLTAGADYEIGGDVKATDVKAGYEVKVTAPEKSNYFIAESGTITKTYDIDAYQAGEEALKVAFGEGDESFTYNGEDQRPDASKVKVELDGKTLTQGEDYDLVYSAKPGESVDVGGYEVKVVLKGNYSGETAKDYKIEKADAADFEVEAKPTEFTYSGKPQGPAVTVKANGTVLEEGKDYTLADATATEKGDYTLKVIGKGNYGGEKTQDYKIKAYPVNENSKLEIRFPDNNNDSFGYNGTPQGPDKNGVEVWLDGKKLDPSQFTITMPEESVNAGSYEVKVELGDNYGNATTAKGYKIEPQEIDVTFKDNTFIWTGGEQGPKFDVKGKDASEVPAEGYEVTGATATPVGDYAVTVKGKGNYTGSSTYQYKIVKAPATSEPADDPKVKETTDTSITIDPTVPGQQYVVVPKNASPEDIEKAWSEKGKTSENGEAIIFDGLEPGQDYEVLTRVPGDESHEPSVPKTTETSTKDTKPEAGEGYKVDYPNELIEVEDGYEIIATSPEGAEPKDWSTGSAKDPDDGKKYIPLTPGATYEVRKKAEPDAQPPVKESMPTKFTVADRQDPPAQPVVTPEPAKAGSETVAISVKPVEDDAIYTVKDKDGNVVKMLTPDPDKPGTYKVTDKNGNPLDPSTVTKQVEGDDATIVVDGLEPNKEYTVEAKTAATGDKPASDPVTSDPVTTAKAEKAAPDKKPDATSDNDEQGNPFMTVDPSSEDQEYVVVPVTRDENGNIVPMTDEEVAKAFENAVPGTGDPLKIGEDAQGNPLKPGTEYQVITRTKAGDDTHAPSKPVTSDPVYTRPAAPDAQKAVDVDNPGQKITPKDGYEILKPGADPEDDGSWVKAPDSIDPFEPGGTYQVRKAADGDVPASDPSDFTAPSRVDDPKDVTVEPVAAGPGSETVAVSIKPAEDDVVYTVTDAEGKVVKTLTPDPDKPGTFKVTDKDGNPMDPAAVTKQGEGDDATIVVDGLEPNKEYTVTSQRQATNDQPASDPKTSDPVTTDKAKGDASKLSDDQKAKAKDSLVYTGEEQPLVDAPTANPPAGYTKMQYATNPNGPWSDEIPTGTNADDYKVYTKYVGEDHEDLVVNGEDNPIEVSIAKADQAAPETAPAAEADSTTSITVDPADAAEEYSIDGGQTWVKPTGGKVTFDGLTPGKDYEVVSRKVEDANHNASEASPAKKVTTPKEEQSAPAEAPSATATTDDNGNSSITVKPTKADEEYSIDGGKTWVKPEVDPETGEAKPVTFDGLEPGKDYQVTSRKIETETQKPSEPSEPLAISTPKAAPSDAPAATGSTDDEGKSSITVDPSDKDQQYVVVPADATPEQIAKAFEDAKQGNGGELTFDGLEPGKDYKVISRYPGDEGKNQDPSPTTEKTVTTPKKAPEDKPEATSKTDSDKGTSSITVNPAKKGQEYVVVPKGTDPDKVDWSKAQPGNDGELTFDGLTPGQDYEVLTRYPADPATGTNPSPSAKVAEEKTPKATQDAPTTTPKATAATDDKTGKSSITVDPANADEEYSIDGGKTWLKPTDGKVTFKDLTPGKDYEVVSRKAGTDTQEPSEPSKGTKVATPKAAIQLGDKNKPTAKDGLSYNGDNQPLVSAPEELPAGCTKVQYSTDGGKTWSDKVPTAADAGTYPVAVKYVGDDQHDDLIVENAASATIGPRQVDEKGGVAPLTDSDGNVVDADGNPLTKKGDGYVDADGKSAEPVPSVMLVGLNPDDPDNVQGKLSKVNGDIVNVEVPTYDAAPHEPKAYDNAVLDAAGIPAELEQGKDYTVEYFAVDADGNPTGKPLNTADPDADDYAFDAGEIVAVVTFKGNHTGTLTAPIKIAKREFHVVTADASQTFNGKPLTNDGVTVWVTGGKDENGNAIPADKGLVTGQMVDVEVTGSQTSKGSSENTYKIRFKGEDAATDNAEPASGLEAQSNPIAAAASILGTQTAIAADNDGLVEGDEEPNAKRKNYTEIAALGTLTVQARTLGANDQGDTGSDAKTPITVNPLPTGAATGPKTSANTNATYTGKPIAGPELYDNSILDANGNPKKLVEGVDYDVAYYDADGNLVENPSDAGTYKMVVTYKGDYEGTYEKEITIEQAELTVKTPSAEKTYDGKALTAAQGATYDGLVNGETIGFEVTGSQTKVDSSRNTYAITWAGSGNAYTAKEGNYKVTEDLGTLTVKAAKETAKTAKGGTTTSGKVASSSTAKTGDEAPLAALVAAMMASLAAILVAGWRRRRED